MQGIEAKVPRDEDPRLERLFFGALRPYRVDPTSPILVP